MEFRTLHLEDKAAVNDVLLPLGRNDSALGFANLYSLTEKYGTQIALEDGVLYVRQLDRIPGVVAYYPPLGTLDIADDVRTLMREAQAEGRRLHLVGLSPKEKEQLEADLPGAFEFSSDRNFADYLYLTKTIAAYEGPGLAKKRRETNKFFQLYGSEASFEPIALDHMDELRAYQQVWFETSRRRGTDEHPLELEHQRSCSTCATSRSSTSKASSCASAAPSKATHTAACCPAARSTLWCSRATSTSVSCGEALLRRARALLRRARRPTSTWKRISACPACARTS